MVRYVLVQRQTPQTTLEGERMVVREFLTEDEASGMSASKIPESGIIMRACYLKERSGKFADEKTGEIRPYYVIEGKIQDDDAVDGERGFSLTLGSQKLLRSVGKAFALYDNKDGKGFWIEIKGRGEDKQRNYTVRAAETLEDLMADELQTTGHLSLGKNGKRK